MVFLNVFDILFTPFGNMERQFGERRVQFNSESVLSVEYGVSLILQLPVWAKEKFACGSEVLRVVSTRLLDLIGILKAKMC